MIILDGSTLRHFKGMLDGPPSLAFLFSTVSGCSAFSLLRESFEPFPFLLACTGAKSCACNKKPPTDLPSEGTTCKVGEAVASGTRLVLSPCTGSSCSGLTYGDDHLSFHRASVSTPPCRRKPTNDPGQCHISSGRVRLQRGIVFLLLLCSSGITRRRFQGPSEFMKRQT